jgi:predicted RND superfamily exporter protein
LILLIGFSAFIPSINTEFNQLMFFKSYTKVQKSFEKILSVNDGALPFYFFGKTDMTNRDATIKELKLMLDDLEDYPAVSHVINPLNLIDNSQNINMSTASQFIHIKNNEVYYRMLIFPKDFNNDTINALYDETAQYNLDGQIAGVQLLMKEMNESIVASQLRSILITFILIIAMLLFSLRSIKLTFIASLPIVITSIILYGFLGLTQIPLNLMTAMIFSISLGIGIDYAIHYTSIYKYHLDHKDQDARELALKYTARPIIANAFGLSLGLTALWLSPLRIHFHISSLMWVAMMTSVFLSLTLIPTLLQKRDRATR